MLCMVVLNFLLVTYCCYAEDMIFDATQYEFFGKNVIEDELEKIEGEMDDIVPFKGFEYETFPSCESDKVRSSSSDLLIACKL